MTGVGQVQLPIVGGPDDGASTAPIDAKNLSHGWKTPSGYTVLQSVYRPALRVTSPDPIWIAVHPNAVKIYMDESK